MMRRNGDRALCSLGMRPEVSFHGVLRVADADRFYSLLIRGIGRHCAFGFGMLQVRSQEGRCSLD